MFLQITCDDPADIDVPGHSYSFGVVKAAQASGDLEVLVERGRRALRVHLKDVDAGLAELGSRMDPQRSNSVFQNNEEANADRHHRTGPHGWQYRPAA